MATIGRRIAKWVSELPFEQLPRWPSPGPSSAQPSTRPSGGKFHRLADGVIAKDTAEQLVEQVMKFERRDEVAELFQFPVLER